MSAESKAAILADESRFQDACGKLVRNGVIQRVSSLMWAVGQDRETSAKLFDVDYDEMCDWFSRRDYEESVSEFIREDADFDQLEAIADQFGYWSDLLDAIGYTVYVETCAESDSDPDDVEDWLKAQDACHEESWTKLFRGEVLDLLTSDSDFTQVGEEYSLEPEYREIYEHWVVDSWLADRLKENGEVVFDFMDFTVWGRCTTGQAILLDGVIRELCREMPDYAYVWE